MKKRHLIVFKMSFLHENTKRFLIFCSHEIGVYFIIDQELDIDLISLAVPEKMSRGSPVEKKKRW